MTKNGEPVMQICYASNSFKPYLFGNQREWAEQDSNPQIVPDNQELATQGPRGGPQPFDPDLAHVVTAWSTLSPSLKKAILAIAQS